VLFGGNIRFLGASAERVATQYVLLKQARQRTLQKEPYISAKHQYISAQSPTKEPYILAKEPCISAQDPTTEPYICAKEPYVCAKEPYVCAKEPYVCAKEPYVSTMGPTAEPYTSTKAAYNSRNKEPKKRALHFKSPEIPQKCSVFLHHFAVWREPQPRWVLVEHFPCHACHCRYVTLMNESQITHEKETCHTYG